MIRLKARAATFVAAMAFAGSGLAGDLPPEIKMQEVSVKDAQGFYVRGDMGYAFADHHRGATIDGDEFDSSRFDGGDFSGAVGVGYQFNDLFRADITGDLFRGDFDGRFSDAGPCAGGAAGTGCAYKDSSSYTAASLMANGYVDLGTVAGFTPYVGAGLGATRLDWSSAHVTGSCVDGAGSCGGAGGTSARYGGDTDWRFTYALMAGVSYDLGSSLKLDLGYRFSHVAGGDMFGSSADGISGRDGALARHEVRVGLRFVTW